MYHNIGAPQRGTSHCRCCYFCRFSFTQTSHIENTRQGLKNIALWLKKYIRYVYFRSFCDSNDARPDRKTSNCSCISRSSHIRKRIHRQVEEFHQASFIFGFALLHSQKHVSCEHNGYMRRHGIVRKCTAVLFQAQIALADLEEHLNSSALPVDMDHFLLYKAKIRCHQYKPVLSIVTVAYKDEMYRKRFVPLSDGGFYRQQILRVHERFLCLPQMAFTFCITPL